MRPIVIDTHIGDNKEVLTACKGLVRGDKLLFNAPTNSGKTTWAKHELPKITGKSVAIAVPTKVIGHNKAEDDIPFYYEHNAKDKGYMPHQEVYICTYEQLASIDLYDTIVIFDEAHNLATGAFRLESFAKALEAVTTGAFATIFMSATIEPLVWNKVYPNAKHIDIRQRRSQEREISFVNVEMDTRKANKADADSLSEVIRAKEDDNHLIVFVEHIATIRELEKRFKHLNPVTLTSEESEFTLCNSKKAKHLIKTGRIPKDCRLVLMTSVGWEGFDILEPDIEFLVINGMRYLSSVSQTPAGWYQMMSRPRLQTKVKMIVVKNEQSNTFEYDGFEWEGMNEDEIKSRYGAIQSALHDKNIGKPYKYDAMMKSEEVMTDAYTLQSMQTSFNKMVPTDTWKTEMTKYGLTQVSYANISVEPLDLTLPPVNNEIFKYLLRTGTDDLNHRYYQGDKYSRTNKIVNRVIPAKDKRINMLMKTCKRLQRRIIPTFDAYSKIESFYTDIDTATVSLSNYTLLWDSYELYILRKLVWRKWAGKTFTIAEFKAWAESKWIYQKHPELLKHRKKILSKQAMGNGIIGKLFDVEKERIGNTNSFTLNNNIPHLNSHFYVQWATRAVYKYYKVRTDKNAKRDYHDEVANIVNEAWGIQNLDAA